MNKVVEQMLQRVPEGGIAEGNLALREVMQEIALAGLYRRGFFGKAAFYGGTCLRIFQQLPRFSEDLDFSLLQSDPEFCLEPYLQGVEEEFAALGIGVEIKVKSKTAPSATLRSATSAQDTASMSYNLWFRWRRSRVAWTTSKTQTLAGTTGPTLPLEPSLVLARDALAVNDQLRRRSSVVEWAS